MGIRGSGCRGLYTQKALPTGMPGSPYVAMLANTRFSPASAALSGGPRKLLAATPYSPGTRRAMDIHMAQWPSKKQVAGQGGALTCRSASGCSRRCA